MNSFEMDSVNFTFSQVVRLHHQRAHHLMGDLGLHPGQNPIMFMLWRKDGRSQKEFAERLNLKPATITVMLKRMEKAGMLERKTDPEDLRVSRVYLTDKGWNLRFQIEEIMKKVDEECLSGFTNEEKMLLRRFLLHMRDNLTNVCNAQSACHDARKE